MFAGLIRTLSRIVLRLPGRTEPNKPAKPAGSAERARPNPDREAPEEPENTYPLW